MRHAWIGLSLFCLLLASPAFAQQPIRSEGSRELRGAPERGGNERAATFTAVGGVRGGRTEYFGYTGWEPDDYPQGVCFEEQGSYPHCAYTVVVWYNNTGEAIRLTELSLPCSGSWEDGPEWYVWLDASYVYCWSADYHGNFVPAVEDDWPYPYTRIDVSGYNIIIQPGFDFAIGYIIPFGHGSGGTGYIFDELHWSYDSEDCEDWHDFGYGTLLQQVRSVSAYPLGVCCQADDCSILTETECAGAGGDWLWESASCDPNPCPVRVCCIDGVCTLTRQHECTGIGAEWLADSTSCDPDPCPPAVYAACCLEGQCTLLTQRQCAETGGEWHAEWTSCEPNLCPPMPVGACCEMGVCELLTQNACASSGGEWHPEWLTCDPNPCTPYVCCVWGDCLATDEETCHNLGGYMELGTCDPNPCWQPPLYACCLGETCYLANEHQCGLDEGIFFEGFESCDISPCGVIDQRFDSPCNGGYSGWSITGYVPCGQGFTPTVADHTGIWVYLEAWGGLGLVTLSIHEWDIHGPVVPGTNVNLTEAVSGWNLFAFSAPVSLQPGEIYVIELEEPNYNYGWRGADGDCYAGGDAYLEGVMVPEVDFWFRARVAGEGACCQGETCMITTSAECTEAGGEWHAGWVSCDPNPCLVRVCCIDGVCSLSHHPDCAGVGAEWHPEWTSCDPSPCPPPVLAACCLEGQCTLLTQRQCADTGGVWHGEWPSCDPNQCPSIDCADYAGDVEIVGSVWTPCNAYGVCADGGFAYVADYGCGLHVIQIGNPENPQIVGTVDTPGGAIVVAVSGTHAYVADYGAGLQVIDISNPQAPHIVGAADTPDHAYSVVVAGNYAYVADYGAGLQVIDICNPQNPHIVGAVNTPGNAVGVAVSGTHAYVGDWVAGLQVVDISNPLSPQIVGTVNTPGNAYGLAVRGTYAYVADYESGLQVIDVTDPHGPHIVGSVDTPGQAYGVSVTGNYAYLADYDYGLTVIDIHDPQNPQIVGASDAGRVTGTAVSAEYVLVADYNYGLRILPRQCDPASSPGVDTPVTSTMFLGAYPNPGSLGQTLIRFQVRDNGPVRADVYDLAGRLICSLYDGILPSGIHEVQWDERTERGHEVPAGMYVIRIATSDVNITRRLVVMK